MTMYGAVPSELRALGLKFVAQQQNVNEITLTVVSALQGTTWTGPARDQFEANWAGSFKPALDGLNAAFEAAGMEAMNRANALEQVMGAGTPA